MYELLLLLRRAMQDYRMLHNAGERSTWSRCLHDELNISWTLHVPADVFLQYGRELRGDEHDLQEFRSLPAYAFAAELPANT